MSHCFNFGHNLQSLAEIMLFLKRNHRYCKATAHMDENWNKFSGDIMHLTGFCLWVHGQDHSWIKFSFLILYSFALKLSLSGNMFSPIGLPAFVALLTWFYWLYVYIKVNILVYSYIDTNI